MLRELVTGPNAMEGTPSSTDRMNLNPSDLSEIKIRGRPDNFSGRARASGASTRKFSLSQSTRDSTAIMLTSFYKSHKSRDALNGLGILLQRIAANAAQCNMGQRGDASRLQKFIRKRTTIKSGLNCLCVHFTNKTIRRGNEVPTEFFVCPSAFTTTAQQLHGCRSTVECSSQVAMRQAMRGAFPMHSRNIRIQ